LKALEKTKIALRSKFEISFEIFYLIFAAVAAVVLFYRRDNIFAWAVIFLLFGDSFHIIPRILRTVHGGYEKALRIGNAVTSVTITLFYVMLYLGINPAANIGLAAITILAVIRIVLYFLPQNNRTSKNPPQSWAIYRNIPFVIIGVITAIACFFQKRFFAVGILIIISFLFYLPVVLYASKNPKIGILMLPKTAAYIGILAILAF
jgi:hypothetical protein